MTCSAEDETCHGDGAWRWRQGRTERGGTAAETFDSEDTDGYITPAHEPNTPITPPKLLCRTRSESRHTEIGTDSDLLEAVTTSLQMGNLEPAALKPCRKRKGSPLLATRAENAHFATALNLSIC